MPDLPPLDGLDPDAPLLDVTVLEIAGEFSGYAGRLLADLGAAVTRVELDGIDPGEQVLPIAGTGLDAAAWFLHRGKDEVSLDPGTDEGRALLGSLIEASDVVIQSGGADAATVDLLSPEAVRSANPAAIHAILSPFGLDGAGAGYVSTDLIRLAAGGLLWLGGYPEASPVAAFGGQSTVATSLFGVVSVLLALNDRDRDGAGETLDVSAQEVVTQGLETSLQEYELTGRVQRRYGSTPREAGTGVFPCADGYVSMVAGRLGTAEAWTRLREWLVEEGTPEAETLWGEGWDELAFRQRPESVARFLEIFGRFASRRTKHDLYFEAQRRRIALAPVNSLAEVLADGQLANRGFFRPVVDPATGSEALVPAPPYRFSLLGPAPDAVGATGVTAAAAGARRDG